MEQRTFHIGCSGYYYPEWRGKFYPADLTPSKWLGYYSTVFNCVELNGTFYRKPKLSDLKRYHNVTPPGFVFSVKASRFITHVLQLKDAAETVREFSELLQEGLQEKFDKLLFQCPPSFRYSPENLDRVFNAVPCSPRNVIEFRHTSWWENHDVAQRFRKEGCIFCNVDYPGIQFPYVITAKQFYLRLHGVPVLFRSEYSEEQLQQFYKAIPETCTNVSVFFNNTASGAAYQNALYFAQLAQQKLLFP